MEGESLRVASPLEHQDMINFVREYYSACDQLREDAIEMNHKIVFVSETSLKECVGVAVVTHTDNIATIVALAVHPMHRHKGIGSKLMCEVENYVQVSNVANCIVMSSNDIILMEKFAVPLGYVEYSGQIDAHGRTVEYRKMLNQANDKMGDLMGNFLAQVQAETIDNDQKDNQNDLFASLLSQMRLDSLQDIASDISMENIQQDEESLDSLVKLLMTQLRDPSHAQLLASFKQ